MKGLAIALVFVSVAAGLFADDDVIPHRQDRLPNKPYSPLEAIQRMIVPEGFHVELVASEPDIVNPIAMTFDDRGRILVTESVEYPRKPAGPGRDRVKIIEGIDANGRAEKVTVFAEGFNIPTGVAVGYGGVWLLNSPDLLFLREKDGKEVSREVVLTGFGRTDFHELPSSLTWGPDGWLYGLNGVFNQSHVIDKDGKQHDFTCAMWRIHPRTREFQIFAEGTSNPYGIAWDAEGSAIIEACHWATDHLFHFVETGYYQRQAGAYPPFAIAFGSITDHGHQKTAYCGIAFLGTDAFPPQYRGRIVVGNLHGGCLNVDRLERDGATYLAKAEPDLLTANDVWFMPVSEKVGADGSLYILDWYDRYHCSQDAVRDPEGVDRLKGRLYRLRYRETPRAPKFDLAAETDDQLIARLGSPNIFFRETAQRILTERGGVRTHRPTQLRNALENLVLNQNASREQRLHVLWALIGSGSLDPSLHEKLFTLPDPTFRAWAVRAAGNFGKIAPSVRAAVVKLARDPSPDVQLQVVIASRKIEGCDALRVVVDVLTHCGHDKLIPTIAWQNLHSLLETEGARFVDLVRAKSTEAESGAPPPHPVPSHEPERRLPARRERDGEPKRAVPEAGAPSGSKVTSLPLSPAIATLLPRAIDRMLSAHDPDAQAIAALLAYAMQTAADRAPQCIAAISAKIASLNDAAVVRMKEQLRPLIDRILTDSRSSALHLSAQLLAARLNLSSIDPAEIRRKFVSDAEPETTRLQVLEALIAFRDKSVLDTLPAVLSSASPQFATKVFAALGRVEDPKLADVILSQYPKLAPELQPLAVDLIFQRESWTRKLLDSVLANKLPKSLLTANHLRKILESDDREAIWAVEKAFGQIREERNPDREKAVAEMGEFLRKNIGDPIGGQRVFKNLCAQCHTIYGEGGKVGPDLTSNGRGSFDQVVTSVFDPSLVIGQGYQTVTVVTKDGRNLTGLVTEDSDQRIVLKMPGEGEEAVPRNNVKYTRVSKLSMMPEGIETFFDKKDLADLFAFLSLDGPPRDPNARLIPGAPAVRR